MRHSSISFDTIQAALDNPSCAPKTSDFDLNGGSWPVDRKLRPAAVLLPLVERPKGIALVLTKRAAGMRNHPGQIAFPGGKVDDRDASFAAAALREAHEEIGLHPQDATILGALPNHETVTSFDVSPFVARLNSAFTPIAEVGEVEEVFEVPLRHVLEPQNYLVQGRMWQGMMRHYYVVPFGPYYIWGATARMLRMFADQVGQHCAD